MIGMWRVDEVGRTLQTNRAGTRERQLEGLHSEINSSLPILLQPFRGRRVRIKKGCFFISGRHRVQVGKERCAVSV
jgi:hypothetical protein